MTIYVVNAVCARCGHSVPDDVDHYINAAAPEYPSVQTLCKNAVLCKNREDNRMGGA